MKQAKGARARTKEHTDEVKRFRSMRKRVFYLKKVLQDRLAALKSKLKDLTGKHALDATTVMRLSVSTYQLKTEHVRAYCTPHWQRLDRDESRI